ncbi:MAG: glycosyltransferase family 2 protein [Candidatus Thermoplasmatota archaeon]
MVVDEKIKSCAIILNYNGEAYIEKTINSLLNQTLVPHIVVVDNFSIDKSVELIEKKYRVVELIKNDRNYNFGKAYNMAIQKRKEEYIFLFNNDMIVEKNSIKNVVEYMEKNEDIGAVSFIGYGSNEKLSYPWHGDFFVKKRFGIDLKTEFTFNSPDDKPGDTLAIFGGACCIRRCIFDSIQFDEDFSWYFEDADLGWMINNRTEYKTKVLPNAVVIHLGGIAMKERFSMKERDMMNYRNSFLSFMKNATYKQLLIALPEMFYFFLFQKNKIELAKLMLKKFKNERYPAKQRKRKNA